MRLIILTLLLHCATAQSDALQQRIRFSSLDDLPGITDNAIYAFEQDHTGFLWIGTTNGVYRFDGYETRHFRADRQQPDSLSSDDVADLLVDDAGRLWIGTWSGGLNLYDESTNRFRRFDQSQGSDAPIAGARSLAAAPDDGLWVGTWGQGLHRMSSADFTMTAIRGQIAPGIDADSLKLADTTTDGNGRVWMAAWDRGLLLYEPANGAWRQWLADEDGVTDARFGRISAIYRRGATIWVGSDIGGIVCIDTRTLAVSCEIPFADGYEEQIRSIYVDDSSHLWVATLGGGLTRIDTVSGDRAVYVHNPATTTSVNSNDVFTLFEDRTGALWIGTLGGGVNFFEIDGQGMAHFESNPLATTTLRSNAVRALAEAQDGGVWIGTDGGGLHTFDPQTESISPYEVNADYYSERIWALQTAPDGSLWIGTWGNGVYQLHSDSNSVSQHLHARSGLGDNVVTLLMLDSQQRLWIGTGSGGTSVYDTQSGTLTSFRHDPNDPTSIAGDSATSFYEDSAGHVWVGLAGAGVNRYLGDQRFERLPVSESEASGLEIEDVLSIIERSDGRFWIGTSYGLGIFDPETRRFSRTLATESTPGGSVVEMRFDAAGDLWIGSNSGLYRYNDSTQLYEQFTRQDGLQSLTFSHGAALAASDGSLYFGGPNGFNRFDPASITSNEIAPEIVITGISILNEPVLAPIDALTGSPTALHQLQALRLEHNQNLISFEFAGLHYVSPADNRYAYQLEGLDNAWNYVPATNRVAHYTNLSPGEYELRIKAANSDGKWASTDRRLSITILPPWWMTSWAYATYAIVFVFLIVSLIQFRTRRLRMYAEQLKADVRRKTQTVLEQNRTIDAQAADLRKALESRNELFARISHEFRTPLTLILGPARLLKERVTAAADQSQLDLIERNTQRVLRLVEQLLGIAKSETVPEAQAVSIDIAPVLESIVASFESAAAEKNLTLRSSIHNSIVISCDPAGFEQVVLNLISNALKYTDSDGEVRIDANVVDANAVIRISDTGIGIPAEELSNIFEPFYRTQAAAGGAQAGTGLGLTVVRDCVRHDGGEIHVDSTPGEGTTVTVSYPVAETASPTPHQPAAQAVGLEVAASLPGSRDELPDVAPATENAPHILIVDDQEDMRRHLQSILAPHYHCRTCSDGEEALLHTREHLPDLVISDIGMPRSDGFELTQSIKGDDRTCHIPVILLTARADEESRHRGYVEHADIYMTKPFDASDLLLRVSNLFDLLAVRRHGMTARLFEDTIDGGVAASADCSPRDRRFLDRLHEVLESRYATVGLATVDIADALAMSERQLQRKLRALLHHSPAEMLRLFRLEKSRARLLAGDRPADVAIDVGFSSQAHFGACFKARYGISPGQFGNGGTPVNP